MMQEHHWKAHREGPLNAWESFQNLNAGSFGEYCEAHMNSAILKHT
jgi:hypothetical protein